VSAAAAVFDVAWLSPGLVRAVVGDTLLLSLLVVSGALVGGRLRPQVVSQAAASLVVGLGVLTASGGAFLLVVSVFSLRLPILLLAVTKARGVYARVELVDRVLHLAVDRTTGAGDVRDDRDGQAGEDRGDDRELDEGEPALDCLQHVLFSLCHSHESEDGKVGKLSATAQSRPVRPVQASAP
jgi:hypothetical protein